MSIDKWRVAVQVYLKKQNIISKNKQTFDKNAPLNSSTYQRI